MLDSIVQLLTVVIIFIFVLVLAYITARLTAGIQKGRLAGSCVEILETLKIAPNKYIQVVKIGGKYFSYIVCKDTVTLLGELTKDDIPVPEAKKAQSTGNVNFKEIFDKFKK
jgi:flagellar protein FliO/FliZ